MCVGACVCVFNTHKSKTFTHPTHLHHSLLPDASWPSTINCWHASFSSFPIPAHALPTKFIYLRLSLMLCPLSSRPPLPLVHSPACCLLTLAFVFGFCLCALATFSFCCRPLRNLKQYLRAAAAAEEVAAASRQQAAQWKHFLYKQHKQPQKAGNKN